MREYQMTTRGWCVRCLGQEVADDVAERACRFMEEAAELFQAMGGSRDDAVKLVEYVFSRPVGEPGQEVGGVSVTLAALCSAAGLDWQDEARAELVRIHRPEVIEKVRAKQASKPHASPLPGSPADAE